MRRQIFDLIDAENKDVIEVLFPNGRTIVGNWYQDHILDAYIDREHNEAKFYIQNDETLWDVELEQFGAFKASASALCSLYLYVSEAEKSYRYRGKGAFADSCRCLLDAIDEFLKDKGYC